MQNELVMDLLEYTNMMELFGDCDYNQEDILEAFSINVGFFDKDKLHDKKYVNDLIKQINQIQVNRTNTAKIYKVIYALQVAIQTAFNISKYGVLVSLPAALIGAALAILYSKLLKSQADNTSINGAKKLVKTIDAQISELEKSKNSADKKEIKEIDNTISKLQFNRETLNKTIKEEEEKLKKK